jgi:hypothetical protein
MPDSPLSGQKSVQAFYQDLQSLPQLISNLALSVDEAQRRLDQNYIDALSKLAAIFSKMIGTDPVGVSNFSTLFKAMGPSRYQFTETVVEVRADLQNTTMSQFSLGGSVGFTAPVAVSINASYTRRNAYDYQASALIRTVLNAIPSDPSLMDTLMKRAGDVPHAELPSTDRYKATEDAFNSFLGAVNSPQSPQSPMDLIK